jgi:hypothetical protein
MLKKETLKLDSYTASGILKDVGNVTNKSTFITTYQTDSDNIFTIAGNGIIMIADRNCNLYWT